jgi:hypothetical protein
LAKIATIQVLGSMEDEGTFSHTVFHKIQIEEHLNTIVRMYFQTFYNLNIFPYDACFEDWKEQEPRQTLD